MGKSSVTQRTCMNFQPTCMTWSWLRFTRNLLHPRTFLSKGTFLYKREILCVAPMRQLDSSKQKARPLLPGEESRHLVQKLCKSHGHQAGEGREQQRMGSEPPEGIKPTKRLQLLGPGQGNPGTGSSSRSCSQRTAGDLWGHLGREILSPQIAASGHRPTRPSYGNSSCAQ